MAGGIDVNSSQFLNRLNAQLAELFVRAKPSKRDVIGVLMEEAEALASASILRKEGGPFAALLVDFSNAIPQVIDVATNRVIAAHDPTAHAEINVIREAARTHSVAFVAGLTLLTSCECCPMCALAAAVSGIDQIYYNATRDDAAKIGFSDAAQYELMASGGIEKFAVQGDDATEKLLDGHDAVLLVPGARPFFGGRYHIDPTGLPCVTAIRLACRELKTYHLPEGTRLISRTKPHPLSLLAASWARIGAKRDKADPADPAKDAVERDISAIQYVQPGWEGPQAEMLWQQLSLPPEERRVPSLRKALLKKADELSAFENWEKLVNTNQIPRY